MVSLTVVTVFLYIVVAVIVFVINLIEFDEAYLESSAARRAARGVLLSVVWPVPAVWVIANGLIEIWRAADWNYERRK